jgi:hypothetical protein
VFQYDYKTKDGDLNKLDGSISRKLLSNVFIQLYNGDDADVRILEFVSY